jgi:hypothetical protein
MRLTPKKYFRTVFVGTYHFSVKMKTYPLDISKTPLKFDSKNPFKIMYSTTTSNRAKIWASRTRKNDFFD